MCYLCKVREARGEALPLQVLELAREQREEQLARERREREEELACERREDELALIARAKAIDAERRHQAEVAWAKRLLSDQDGPTASAGRETISRRARHGVWQRDLGKCVECGSSERLEFDHIIPVAMGGSSTERNLQLLCEVCNRRKGKSLD
jgi:5-methylcytosine-specific restriction endonuclease McrA